MAGEEDLGAMSELPGDLRLDPDRVGQRCDFCGSSALVPYEEIKEAFRPESLLPMKVGETQVRDSVRKWYALGGSRPTNSNTPRYRHRQGPLHSLLDLRRPGAC